LLVLELLELQALFVCTRALTLRFMKKSLSGGKLSTFKLGNYRFDAGPSLFTMPNFVDELFQLAGKDPRNYFKYIKHDNSCNYFGMNQARS
jgi:hypothetical protein